MSTDTDKQDLDRIIRKIKHCLALARSSNEHEAAAALRQAKKLMDKYRLTETDIHLSTVGRADIATSVSRLKRWERTLAAAVAETFNCQTIITSEWNDLGHRRKGLYIVGVSPAQDIARYAYEALHVKLCYDRRRYIKRIKAQGGASRTSHETRGDHFAIAWVSEVWSKLEALKPGTELEEFESDSKALVSVVVRENELIDAYFKAVGVKEGRKSRDIDADPIDLLHGLRAGQAAEPNLAVTASGQDQLSITADRAGTSSTTSGTERRI